MNHELRTYIGIILAVNRNYQYYSENGTCITIYRKLGHVIDLELDK